MLLLFQLLLARRLVFCCCCCQSKLVSLPLQLQNVSAVGSGERLFAATLYSSCFAMLRT